MQTISINGTALNPTTNVPSPFAMQFNLDGGTLQTAGCDSALMGAQVSGFSAEIGNASVAAPTDFLANVTLDPYPTCTAQAFGELVGGPVVLQTAGAVTSPTATFYGGSVNGWYISQATWNSKISAPELSVPEPSMIALAVCAALIASGKRFMYSRADAGG